VPTTLKDLLRVRSALVEEVMAYLDSLAKSMAALPKYYPTHLRSDDGEKSPFDEVRQVVQVVEDRDAFARWLAEEREWLRATGQDFERVLYAPNRAWPEDTGGSELRRHDQIQRDRSKLPELIRWDENDGKHFKRAIILGDPGFGKTWLLHYEARLVARKQLEKLTDRMISLDQVILPIFARLSDLNASDGKIEDALVSLTWDRLAAALAKRNREDLPANQGRQPSEAFCNLIRKKLHSEHCVILLDAWDEVPVEVPSVGEPIKFLPNHRQRLGQRLEAFASSFPHPRLLVTSRIVGYTDLRIDAKELELLAFDAKQIESFARVWFGSDTETANEFLTKIREQHQVRGLARIPLMLALLCRVYSQRLESGCDFPSRRVELYDLVLRGLLRDWKGEKQRRNISEGELNDKLELLSAVSYPLLEEGYEQFSESVLKMKISSWLAGLKTSHRFYGIKAYRLVDELKIDGILISAGEHPETPLLFLHRTFHEYLAAQALVQQRTWLKLALAHVYDLGWHEVLTLSGGMLKDEASVRAYISELLNENRNDLLCRPLRMAIYAAAEIDSDYLANWFFEGILKITIALYCKTPRLWAFSKHLDPIGEPFFAEFPSHKFPPLKFASLVVCWGKRALPHLMPLLAHESLKVRTAAAEAIGRIGSTESVPHLLPLFMYGYEETTSILVEALGQIGARAVYHLLPLLRNENYWVRQTTVMALGRIGSDEAIPYLLPLLEYQNLSREDEPLYWCAKKALTQIGQPVVPYMLTWLKDWNSSSHREAAAEVLGQIGLVDAIPHLVPLLGERDDKVRRAGADALGDIGSAEAIPHLSSLLRDEVTSVRNAAIAAMGHTRSASIIQYLLPILKSPLLSEDDFYGDGASWAAWALGELGSAEVIPHLLPLLSHEDWRVRLAVIRALGHTKAGEIIPHLLPILKSPLQQDKELEDAAIEALEQCVSPEAVPYLLRLLEDENPTRLCKTAARALGQIGSTKAIPYLLRLLNSADWERRASAAEALGRIGSIETAPYLLPLLQDEIGWVYDAAAEALERIAPDKVVPCLLPELSTGHWTRRMKVVQVLGRIGSVEALPLLLPHIEGLYGEQVVVAVWQIGQRQRIAVPLARAPRRIRRKARFLARSIEALVQSWSNH
jgi:HEAT repeat protein